MQPEILAVQMSQAVLDRGNQIFYFAKASPLFLNDFWWCVLNKLVVGEFLFASHPVRLEIPQPLLLPGTPLLDIDKPL